ncbi:unnamed protein product [Rhizophagus irregularis]|nr:unnamed protein product [Rhizophagus irregularis]
MSEKNFNITTKEWKYKIGTCFVCRKCLYCGVNLAEGSVCNCEKTLKPTNSSKTKKFQVGHVRNGVYKHNESHPILVALLQSNNDIHKYQYDLSKKFNFTLCAKCNSQLVRDQNTYNKNNLISIDEKENQTVKTPTKPLNPSKLNNVLNSNSDIPFRFKLIIKTPDLTKPAKAITLEKIPAYFEFDDLVLQKVCETVGLVVRTKYELSYKAEKGTGAGTILEEEEDFEEFIREYHRLTISDKALLITATVKQKEKAKRKKKSLEISDGNESGEIHKKLKEMHECNIHKTGYCYIKDDRHLLLTTLHLSMWTDEIIIIISDNNANYYQQQYVSPPNSHSYYSGWPPYPPPYPPSHLSSYLSSQALSYLPPSSHTQFASTLDVASQTSQSTPSLSYEITEPSIKDFLELLDKKFGEARYTIYLQKFEEEEITVSQLAEMNPEVLLNEFGIEIIGRRLNLIKEAKNFL